MGKGLGIIQKKVLRIMGGGSTTMSAVRSKVYPYDYKHGWAKAAVSRAIRNLESRGLVERGAMSKDSGCRILSQGRFYGKKRDRYGISIPGNGIEA